MTLRVVPEGLAAASAAVEALTARLAAAQAAAAPLQFFDCGDGFGEVVDLASVAMSATHDAYDSPGMARIRASGGVRKALRD